MKPTEEEDEPTMQEVLDELAAKIRAETGMPVETMIVSPDELPEILNDVKTEWAIEIEVEEVSDDQEKTQEEL
jgi:wyosine [tRNA(Phe)-imidazoG37] synthetase (radical SAM superfamily)